MDRYEEALERARKIYNDTEFDYENGMMEEIFPELADSKDERIRKYLIERIISAYGENSSTPEGIKVKDIIDWLEKQKRLYSDYEESELRRGLLWHLKELQNIEESKGLPIKAKATYNDWIAWLEKQGGINKLSEEEQNRFAKGVLSSCAISFIDYLDAHKYEGKMCVSNGECEDIENAFHNAMWDRLHRYYCKYIEKQGEQKPTVIIPKFRVGDEIKTSNEEPLTITKIDDKGYWSEDLFICGFDDTAKWELVEQKPTDKIESFNKYEGLTDFERTLADICIGWIGEELGWKQYIKDNADVLLKIAIEKFNSVQDAPFEQKPADNVEPKFKAGDKVLVDGKVYTIKVVNEDNYIVDENGREVQEHFSYTKDWKPYKQNDAWNEEDETGLSDALWAIQQAITITKDENDMGNLWYAERWLKSIKNRVQHQPNCEWSEEDDRNILIAIQYVFQHGYLSTVDWLKSLKDRVQHQPPKNQWRPSDEQMEALEHSLGDYNIKIFEDRYEILKSLYNELKKLKG